MMRSCQESFPVSATGGTQSAQAAGVSNSEPIVDVSRQKYSYDELLTDLDLLQKTYPDLIFYDFTAVTAQGRKIPEIVMGNPDGVSISQFGTAGALKDDSRFRVCVYLPAE